MTPHTIAISTPTLLLRPFRRGDAVHFAAAVRESAASVGRWMPWPRADYTPDMALAWFADCAAQRRAGTARAFGIFSRDGRTLLGGAGLNRIDAQHRSANLGYWVRHACEGQGIATQAARALLDFGFDTLQLARIEIVTAQGNAASAAVARKAGATLECIARNRLIVGGQPVTAHVFARVPMTPTAAHAQPACKPVQGPRRTPPPTRVVLRTLRPDDARTVLAAARISRALHHPWLRAPQTPQQFRALLARAAQPDHHTHLVCLREGGTPVGVINLSNIVRGAFASAYLSYYVFAGHERQGLMREALHAAVRHAFGALKLHRLEANIQPGNAASRALVRACGFTLEGFSPRYLKIGGRWRDHERWARLADAPRRAR
ncbi:MAG: GNAT family N-acetyltransferase [Metallibacterium scheffleri]|jgi:ribosomal-protein-alanine N-acetyltransferase|uniref:GNAT family N-acetyltransferase n=1 Tax=Metallibacterium scheffleri TaxID=993689 RepID=UPI0026ED01C0|nr:GNAT family N-acetyltransferase [Metallibacterium scheffleri]MCK9368248.1 GNAT family N-acetyltransferase [Metallibacterium scheffleri]